MRRNQRGFTLIELMIATSVFSVVLLIASNGIVQIGRMYYKGIVTVRTQEAVRSTVSDISNSLQLTGGQPIYSTVTPPGSQFVTKAICIGKSRYTYQIDVKIDSNVGGHALWLDDQGNGTCTPANLSLAEPSSTGRELLGANMRLLRFTVNPPAAGSNLYTVGLTVAYGDSDLLTNYDINGSARVDLVGGDGVNEGDAAAALCRSGVSGSNFCAVSGLDSSVKKRLL